MMEELKKIIKEIDAKLNTIFSPNGKKIFITLVCVGIILFFSLLISFMLPSKTSNEGVMSHQENDVSSMQEVNVAGDDVNEADGAEVENKIVSLNVDGVGRANPFLPSLGGYDIDVMAPPTSLPLDTESSKILSTKVSGIMYDSKNPSAILNIDGMDYFVKAGDYIDNYRVVSITRDLVTVKSGANVYRASVGQLISDAPVSIQSYNLQNRFGGKK